MLHDTTNRPAGASRSSGELERRTTPTWMEPRVETRTPAERQRWSRSGKIKPMILLWALGVPIPIIIVIFLVRGCVG